MTPKQQQGGQNRLPRARQTAAMPARLGQWEPGWLIGKLKPWAVWLALAALLLLATILRLVMRLGFSNRDSFDYVIAAMKLNELGAAGYLANISNIYENRVAIVFPLALVFRLFGASEASATLMPFTAALLAIIIAFFLGYTVSPRAGLIAALIVATLPQEVGLSSSILPDSLIPFYTGASLLCLWLGMRRDSFWLFILSGAFLFLAFQSRATSAVLAIPLVLAATWSSQRSLKSIVTPVATFIILLLLFWIILYAMSGDPLVQYRWFASDATMERFVGTGEFLGYFKAAIARLNPDFGLLFHLAILALLFAAYRSPRFEKYRLPMLSLLVLYLFFEFGSTTVTTYEPIWKLGRFLTILTIPAAMLVALTADDLLLEEGRVRRYTVFGLLSAQLILGVAYVLMYGSTITTAVHVEKSTYERVIQRLGEYDGATVAVVEERWTVWGPVYAAFQGDSYHFTLLQGVPRQDLAPETIVVFAPMSINASGFRTIDFDNYPALTGLPAQIPSGWELLFTEPLMEPPAQDKGDPVRVYRISE